MSNKISILGGGESGVGAAVLATRKGFEVFLSDHGKIDPVYREVLRKNEIDFEEGGHTWDRILDARKIVKSPGIPDNVPLVIEAKRKGVPVISEIEFAAGFTTAKKICVTGSNGKTTTTMLIYSILKNAGLNVGLAGNVGKSFAYQVAENDFDYYVLEISSFQLDGMFDFKADIAVLTNITPDHLDRYDGKFEKYIDSKFRILQNMNSGDAFIYTADDPVVKREVSQREIVPVQYPVTLKQGPFERGAWLVKNKIIVKTDKKEEIMTLEELALQGKHNVYNSMAASVAANLLAIRKESVKQSLMDFESLPHRLEYVANVHGITFINDSKATNVNSTWYALEQMDAPTVWIAGGQDKGNDYSGLVSLVREKVKAIVCLGKDNSKLHEVFGDIVNKMVDVTSAEDAVEAAYQLAQKGDIVLLSPACASFDLFENYQDRGDKFKNAVKAL